MGLDISHGAFSAAYSAFNRFRMAVAKVMGGSFPPHDEPVRDDGSVLDPNLWYWGDEFSQETHPGLGAFLAHSDCDGEMSPKECELLANELEALLPKLDELGMGAGQIQGQGGYGALARRMIKGCRCAAEAGEALIFQ